MTELKVKLLFSDVHILILSRPAPAYLTWFYTARHASWWVLFIIPYLTYTNTDV